MRELGHVVEREHHAASIQSRESSLHRGVAPRFLEGIVTLRGCRKRKCSLRQLRRHDLQQRARGHTAAEQRLGAWICQHHPCLAVQRDHARRHGAQHRIGATTGRIERALAGAQVVGHAAECIEYRHELTWRCRIQARCTFTGGHRDRGVTQRADGACELPRRQAGQPERRKHTGECTEEQQHDEILATLIERLFLEHCRCRDDDAFATCATRAQVAEQHIRAGYRHGARCRQRTAGRECQRDIRRQEQPDRCQCAEQFVAHVDQSADGVSKQRHTDAATCLLELRTFARSIDGAQEFTHEQFALFRVIGTQPLKTPDREHAERHHEEKQQHDGQSKAVAAAPRPSPHAPPAPCASACEPCGPREREKHCQVRHHQQRAALDQRPAGWNGHARMRLQRSKHRRHNARAIDCAAFARPVHAVVEAAIGLHLTQLEAIRRCATKR